MYQLVDDENAKNTGKYGSCSANDPLLAKTSKSGTGGNQAKKGQGESSLERWVFSGGVPWLGPHVVLAALSNLSVQYNMVNIGTTLLIMQETYEESADAKSLCSTALFVGMVIGQVGLGFLGDWLGRRQALVTALFLGIVGSLGSALSYGPGVFLQVALWRFILGIGAGGVYPIAATYAKESCPDPHLQATVVAFVFSMQGLGHFLAPATTYLVLQTVESADLQWRLNLGFGALQLIGVLCLLLAIEGKMKKKKKTVTIAPPQVEEDGEGSVDSGDAPVSLPMSPRNSSANKAQQGLWGSLCTSLVEVLRLLRDPEQLKLVVGAAGTWFLFDVTFYGNTLFQGQVLENVFGATETTREVARQEMVVYAFAVPGYYLALFFMARMGPKIMQLQGFVLMALLYALIGLFWNALDRVSPTALLLLYGLTFLFSNFGPNSTTFVLPSLTFPARGRSSLNGICAAMGKLGAIVGSSCFSPLSEEW
eukprot:CAMPEP_0113940770 /NCGR_PEP_ID=MMETSP1339-20121228/6833_1 /TAXON_ID=94617 /ORGANISM="Fibrocapsa japonica" /LENGTH=479 /DNA_ID=CAMNT_0000944719 /DNA_START=87 /DNA_END=1523 /DNA_ORIENTATION=- /assembly_acc=CAM_ASM_000762